jgi:hypothetical protein
MRDVRPLVCLCALAATVAVAGEAALSPVRATMTTSSTKPVADTPWRYTIVVENRAGEPLAAKVRLQVLRGDEVVRCWNKTALKVCSGANAGTWIPFTGKRTGIIVWPAEAAGLKLTFRAIVVTGSRSLRLRAPVRVRLP